MKWFEVIPLWSKSACEVAIVFYQVVFAHNGQPKWIKVDAGQKWEGDFRLLSELLEVTMRAAAAGYPRMDG